MTASEPGRRDPASTRPQDWPTGRLLSAAARQIERAWDAHLAHWNLSHASVPILVHLLGGDRSQREIAARMGVTEQSIGRMLKSLQSHGYITREQHRTDRRRRVVTITSAGREALAGLDSGKAVESLMGDALDPEGVAQLRSLLIRLLDPAPERGRDSDAGERR